MNKTSTSAFLSSPPKRFILVGGLYVLLWLATWYSARLLDSLGVVSLWFLPAGLRFACLLVFGWRGLVLELLVQLAFALMQFAGLAGAPIVDVWSEQSLWRVYNLLASLFGNALILLAVRTKVGDATGKTLDFTHSSHCALFFVLAVLVSTISAVAGTFGLLRLGYIPSAETVKVATSWMIGDFIGIVTLVPLLLVRVVPGVLRYLASGRWRSARQAAALDSDADLRMVLIMVSALVLLFVLPWSLELEQQFPLVALLLLIPLAGVALHYGLRVTVFAVVLLDGGLVLLIAASGQQTMALQYQIVMISIALVGLLLGGAVETRNRSMARYRDFAGMSNDLLWEVDRDGFLGEVSGELARYAGLQPGLHWRAVPLAGEAAPRAALEHAMAQQQAFRHLEFTLAGARPNQSPTQAPESLADQADDNVRRIVLNGMPLFDELGAYTGYRGTAVDVTGERRAKALLRDYNMRLRQDVAARTRELYVSNQELAAKERHLQVLLSAAPVGVIELDADDQCRYLNANACSLIARAPDAAHGLHFLELVHPDDQDYVRFIWKNVRQSEDVQSFEFRLAGSELRCAAHLIKLSGDAQPIEGAVIVLTNATARSEADERLWTLAHRDALTDLPNRNLFWDRLGQSLRGARRNGHGAAVLWIDLDGFKAVNDRFGHAAGDVLLQQVARRLEKKLRDSDTVARLGGDEFAVIIPDIGQPEITLKIAQQLLATLAETFELPQGSASISGSIGVALFPQHAETPEALTQCADMAMYAAKHAGKNQVRVWNDG